MPLVPAELSGVVYVKHQDRVTALKMMAISMAIIKNIGHAKARYEHFSSFRDLSLGKATWFTSYYPKLHLSIGSPFLSTCSVPETWQLECAVIFRGTSG